MTTCQLVFSPGAGKADCWELPFPCASQQRWGWQPFRWLNIHQTESLPSLLLFLSQPCKTASWGCARCWKRWTILQQLCQNSTSGLGGDIGIVNESFAWPCDLSFSEVPPHSAKLAALSGLTNVFSNKSFPLCNFCRNLECTWCRKQILHRKYGLLMGKDLEDFDLFCKDRWDSSLPKVDVPSPQVIHLSAGQAL